MSAILPYVGLFLALAAVIALLLWGAYRVRRRGSGGGVAGALAAHDELWYPTRHESHFEQRIDEERKKPNPTPDK